MREVAASMRYEAGVVAVARESGPETSTGKTSRRTQFLALLGRQPFSELPAAWVGLLIRDLRIDCDVLVKHGGDSHRMDNRGSRGATGWSPE